MTINMQMAGLSLWTFTATPLPYDMSSPHTQWPKTQKIGLPSRLGARSGRQVPSIPHQYDCQGLRWRPPLASHLAPPPKRKKLGRTHLFQGQFKPPAKHRCETNVDANGTQRVKNKQNNKETGKNSPKLGKVQNEKAKSHLNITKTASVSRERLAILLALKSNTTETCEMRVPLTACYACFCCC